MCFLNYRAVYFCTYSQVKSICNNRVTPNTPYVHMVSAASAGFVSSTFTNPIWFVKTRMQLDERFVNDVNFLPLQLTFFVYHQSQRHQRVELHSKYLPDERRCGLLQGHNRQLLRHHWDDDSLCRLRVSQEKVGRASVTGTSVIFLKAAAQRRLELHQKAQHFSLHGSSCRFEIICLSHCLSSWYDLIAWCCWQRYCAIVFHTFLSYFINLPLFSFLTQRLPARGFARKDTSIEVSFKQSFSSTAKRAYGTVFIADLSRNYSVSILIFLVFIWYLPSSLCTGQIPNTAIMMGTYEVLAHILTTLPERTTIEQQI